MTNELYLTQYDNVAVPQQLAEQVLTVGFEYRNHRGGIGGVIDTYSHYFPTFKFVATYPTHPKKGTLPFYFLRNYISVLSKLIQDPTIQIVHIHGAAKGSFFRKFIIFLTAKYIFRRKVIYHSHGSEFKVFYTKSPSFVKRMIHHFIEGADVIICLSEQWELFFRQHFAVKKLVVLGNVVEPPQDLPQKDVYRNRPLRLLFLGLIGHRKGIFDLLDTIRANKEYLTGKLTLTVGGNGDVDRLKSFIQQHQLEAIINFVGWVSGETKKQLLQESDVYILPSYNEGLPLSILEAMSYGLPILSTPVGGTAEIVLDGANGWLFQPGDNEAMMTSIDYFIKHPDQVRIMGNASTHQIKPFYPDKIFNKLINVYADLL